MSILKMNHETWVAYLTKVLAIMAAFGAVVAGICGFVFGIQVAAYATYYGVLVYGACQLAVFAIPVIRKILGKS